MVKSRSDHDVAHLHPLTNVPTKYQLPTPYSFRDIARTRFFRSRSLQQGQRSNEGQTMHVLNIPSMAFCLLCFNVFLYYSMIVNEMMVSPGCTWNTLHTRKKANASICVQLYHDLTMNLGIFSTNSQDNTDPSF